MNRAISLMRELRLITEHRASDLTAVAGDTEIAFAEDFLVEHIAPELPDIDAGILDAAIESLQRDAEPDWPRVRPRDAKGRGPSRSGYQRGEAELAKRHGWSAPQRFVVEEHVRRVAVVSLTEADFVLKAERAGIQLIPRVGTSINGVVAYSAQLLEIAPALRRAFGGSELARDLALNNLRKTWGQDPISYMAAWATWHRHTGAATRTTPPSAPPGVWRWAHPALATRRIAAPDSIPPNRREAARAMLRMVQGNVCAMCQIRYRQWDFDGSPTTLMGPPDHLDHDHETGLIRGLLCNTCNTLREPIGAKANEDVRAAYVADPPAIAAGCSWPW